MKNKNLLPIFSATLFLSAFLIFAVQPMVSKMLLPMLGGSPSVWNTAMVFFQAMLLAGYAYAHFVARFVPLKAQAFIHIALLCLFTLVLPLALPADAIPPENDGQALWQLGVMLTCVGGPFFVLAASAPLFQHWFSASGHKDAENPYFLYALSNAGSMISLLSYPLIIEPLIGVHDQTILWSAGYMLLIAFTAVCAWMVRGGAKPAPATIETQEQGRVRWLSRLAWVGLAFIPSSLMLGVTTLITTDLASVPFLWVLPLAIYLGTFIIAFSKKPLVPVIFSRELCAYAVVATILITLLSGSIVMTMTIIIVHLVTFTLGALLCHSELARIKPAASRLTEFYLLISLGGVLGGIFNALIAPKIFLVPLEYRITLAMLGFVIWAGIAKIPYISLTFNSLDDKSKYRKNLIIDIAIIAAMFGLYAFVLTSDDARLKIGGAIVIFVSLILLVQNRFVFAITAAVALCAFQPAFWSSNQKLLSLDRNYFGVLKVYEKAGAHQFFHGTTLHGAQWQSKEWKLFPVSYYSPNGPASNVFEEMSKRPGKQNIGVIGLGVGSVVCYKKPGRHFDFYEIDEDVVRYAEDPRYFSYLKDCGNYDVILGDGRMKISEKPDATYDMLFLDAFSSDNIPVHVMTLEAFKIYVTKLKPGGIITMNISNRFFDLRPALAGIAKELGLTFYYKQHLPKSVRGEASELYVQSTFVVMAKNSEDLTPFIEKYEWKPYVKDNLPIWTDDYANILGSLNALK